MWYNIFGYLYPFAAIKGFGGARYGSREKNRKPVQY